jgi:hypothetical protein
MSISISSAANAVQAPVAVPPASTKQSAAVPTNPQPAPTVPPAATVNISAAAKALQEAIETPTQTAHEAAAGDSQARRLLAREVAAEAANK